jgi:hypothetical protein
MRLAMRGDENENWLDRLRRRLDSFLSGSPPADPLCVSNRTLRQKLLLSCLVAAPFLLLAGLLVLGLNNFSRSATPDVYDSKTLPPRVVVGRPVSDPRLQPVDLEVLNIRIVKDVKPRVVTGVVRNNTGKSFKSAQIIYLLADENGSLIGTEVARVANLGPHDSVTFRARLQAERADAVEVREIRAN